MNLGEGALCLFGLERRRGGKTMDDLSEMDSFPIQAFACLSGLLVQSHPAECITSIPSFLPSFLYIHPIYLANSSGRLQGIQLLLSFSFIPSHLLLSATFS